MLVNREVLSVPPYISTSWVQINALYMEESVLVVCLKDNIVIKVPDLSSSDIRNIFEMHAAYFMEKKEARRKKEIDHTGGFEMPVRFGMGLSMGNGIMENMISSGMQHNPEQAHMPDIPKEIINKIATITKIISPEDVSMIPKGEPHCNCAFCQVSRAIHEDENKTPEILVEQVLPPPPQEPWIIEPSEGGCYQVSSTSNPVDTFKVFIKDGQVGCNCGQHGCEHIIAVLRS